MTVYFWIILTVCVLDQLTKVWAMDLIAAANHIGSAALTGGMTKPILEDALHFTYLENRGMSFGLLADHRWVFITLSFVGIAAMLSYLIYIKGKDKLLSVSLALVIGRTPFSVLEMDLQFCGCLCLRGCCVDDPCTPSGIQTGETQWLSSIP